MIDTIELIRAATGARASAFAPYSSFQVGAALLDEAGRVFLGCNVENVSFGLTMCAERVAVGAAVAAKSLKWKAIAIVSDSAEPVTPCGACRQVLAEFNPSLKVISANLSGATAEFDLENLLPLSRQGILG